MMPGSDDEYNMIEEEIYITEDEYSAEDELTLSGAEEDILEFADVAGETAEAIEEELPEEEDEETSYLLEDESGTDAGTGKNMIGVRFRITGKIYYFDAGDFEVRRTDHVIVETVRGVEYGYVVADAAMLQKKRSPKPLKKITRVADEKDAAVAAELRKKEREAYKICQERIRGHQLEMKLIDAEYTFDSSKLLFYFTADGRVDFRDLVKDLATIFRTRIELRQIGVRDETQILGGYGICGRVLCCHSFLTDFVPVSIKMAKEQSLSLNQTKISGVCGRLMCCLKNEEETYEELKRTLPGIGDEVEGADGLTGEVSSVNVLRQTIKILTEVDDEKELHEYGEGEWTLIRKRRRGQARHPKKDAQNEKAQSDKSQNERSQNEKPQNERALSDKPQGEKPQNEKPVNQAEQFLSDRASGEKPQGVRPADDKGQKDKEPGRENNGSSRNRKKRSDRKKNHSASAGQEGRTASADAGAAGKAADNAAERPVAEAGGGQEGKKQKKHRGDRYFRKKKQAKSEGRQQDGGSRGSDQTG